MLKIVIAGEPDDALAVIEAELTGCGHEVVAAANGQEAYETVLREKPDAVFLGARMPVFDGLTTCRMLRDDPDCPSNLPVLLIAKHDIDARSLERAEVTEVVKAKHEASEIRELLARHAANTVWPM